jgi:peptide/nickel transport system permease protein
MNRSALAYFIGKRLVALALLLVAISFLVFSLLYLAPGNAVDMLLAGKPRTPETVRLLNEQYHLDDPFLVQYGHWLANALRLDFGESITTTLPVQSEITARLPVTFLLAVYAFTIEMVIGLSFGVIAALRQRTVFDRGLVAVTVVGLSTPAFVSGIFLLYLFSVRLGWFPVFGAGEGLADRLVHLTLPAFALALVGTATIVKHTRASVLNVLDEDFVTFARARGLSRSHVLLRYVLRNALIPIVGVSVMILSFLLVGAVFVEVTFSISGLGLLVVQASNAQDVPMIQGVAMLIAIVVMGGNLVADLLYLAVDPRLRARALG